MKNSLIHRAAAALLRGGHDTKRERAKQVLNRTTQVALASVVAFVCGSSSLAAAPSAQEILGSVRMQQARQQVDLQGQLREGELVVPFRLTQTGPVIRYSFTNPDEALQLRLGQSDSRLEQISAEGVDRVSGPELAQNVRGTAIKYEDLALKFLYWPRSRVLGEDSIRTRDCWKVQVEAPSRSSQYSNVVLWVDKEGGALMRMEGYDANLKLSKRFEVVSAQKIEGRWFLKSMRIEHLEPGTGKVQTRTYLEIKK